MMIMNKTKKPGGILYVVGKSSLLLEQMTRYKYLGNWATEDARRDENIRTRVGMAK